MATKKRGLGAGLDSIFQNTGSVPLSEGVNTIRISEIEPDKNQPRKIFDETALQELASSIDEHGVLQPIVVRSLPTGGYSIIAGERRWRASRLAGLNEIPAMVMDVSDEAAMEIALIENLQREDLDPVEEALGYKQLMERCEYTQEKLAAKLSKSRSAVANSMRILALPESILQDLRDNTLTLGHAKAILSLKSEDLQIKAANISKAESLSVRETEVLCKKLAKAPTAKKEVLRDSLPTEVECSLKEQLGTEVRVQYKDGKGSLNISFYDNDQLRAFANLLGNYKKEK
ncbi:MAG: ParB/RepB/Spo0J family partition protein [Oscillospiraceae bacterium]